MLRCLLRGATGRSLLDVELVQLDRALQLREIVIDEVLKPIRLREREHDRGPGRDSERLLEAEIATM